MTHADFFSFDAFDVEIERKLRSLDEKPEEGWKALLALAEHHGCSKQDSERATTLFKRLRSFPFDSIYHGYLIHPLRVTASFVLYTKKSSYETLSFGLCHNVIENSFDGLDAALDDFLSAQTWERIESMTINRGTERDPEYLASFYDALAERKDDLLLFKALDKLDNLLWAVAFEPDQHEEDVLLHYLCPRIAESHPRLEKYLRELIPHVKSAETKKKFSGSKNT